MTQDDFEGAIYDYCRCILIPEEKQDPVERSKEYRRNLLSLIALYAGVECIDIVDTFKDLDCKCEDVDDPKFVDLVTEITRRINNISKSGEIEDFSSRITQYVNASLRNEIVRNIDTVFDQLKKTEDSRDKLRDEFEKFKANARNLANVELIEENKKLKAELKLCYGGYKFDTKKELKVFKTFEKKHKHDISSVYVVFKPCGLGIQKTAICQKCGETEDITDTSLW